MKTRQLNAFVFVATIALLVLLAQSNAPPTAAQTLPPSFTPPSSVPDLARVSAALRSSPVMFIENAGQFDKGARFQVRGGNGTIWLADDALWVTVLERSDAETRRRGDMERFSASPTPPVPASRKGVNLKLSFVGANPKPRLEPFNRLDTHVSYFTGNDPKKWHADVPVWGGVRYKDLYPGIDLELTGESEQWQLRVVARTGANLNAVRLRVDGADKIALDGERLRLTTAVGEYRMPLFRVDGSVDRNLSRPSLTGNQVASPFTSATPTPQSAIANPKSGASDLLYSTFLGGSGQDWSRGIATDKNGAVYVSGTTSSSDFPVTSGAFDTSYDSGDIFVVKLDATGSSLAYATFLGGSRSDEGYSITVDENGAAYVTGWTVSSDFPTTPGAFDTTCGTDGTCNYYSGFFGPFYDAFVAKLNSDGTALVYSTFLGGGDDDRAYGIAVDARGAAYVTGTTWSDFPTTPGAYDTTRNGFWDTFVAKLNATGSALVYSTFLGGTGSEAGYGIAVDESGAAYVAGETYSSDFPTTSGAFDTSHNGGIDAFVVKLSDSGSGLIYSTFLGGISQDSGWDIAIDGSGAAYITGLTQSYNFPTTPGAFDTTLGGGNDAFVVKLNVTGSALVYGTFLGGRSGEGANALMVDASGAVYVTGTTGSPDFPTTSSAFDTTCGTDGNCDGYEDAFVAKLNPTGSALLYATFLGGQTSDYGYGIAVDLSGMVLVMGQTTSSDFPTTLGTFDTSYNGALDAFVVKLKVAPFCIPTDGFVGYIYDPAPDGLHKGIDLWTRTDGSGSSGSRGNAVFLPYDGVLTNFIFDNTIGSSGSTPKQGFTFRHDNAPWYGTLETRYFHMADNDSTTSFINSNLQLGQVYTRGTFLGYQGNRLYKGTGDVLTHLHFVVVQPPDTGTAVDPSGLLGHDFASPSTEFGWLAPVPSQDVCSGSVPPTPTNTPTPTTTATPTSTPTATATATSTSTPTATQTSTGTPTATSTPTPSQTCTSTSTPSPTTTATGTTTVTPTRTSTATCTFTPSSTATTTGTTTATPTHTSTTTRTFTPMPSPTRTLTPTPTPALGTTVDLSVDSVLPIQVLEGQSLIKNKATAVKAVIRKTGNGTANNVSVQLTLVLGGSFSTTRFFVAEPSNMDAQFALVADNTDHPLSFASNEFTKTIYFFSGSLAPTGNEYEVFVTVDYLGTITETNEANNTTTSLPVSLYDTNWSGLLFPDFYIHYFRTDWGNTPITNFDNYYQTSNDFVKGVYPVSSQRFAPNKSNNYVGNTSLFRGGDGRLDTGELGWWIRATLPQMRIAHPTADRFISTVPSGWFAANTTGGLENALGVAYPAMRELVISEARTTSKPNGPSIAAHEIGHSYQLDLDCEEYNTCNTSRQDSIGNYASSGLWVDKRIPIQVSADRKIYCFMGAYADREFWIDANDYSKLLNDHKTTAPLVAPRSATQAILAVGTFDISSSVTLNNWYVLPEAELSVLPSGPYTFEYQDAGGGVLYQQSFDVSFDLMGTTLTESPFVFTIPYVAGTTKIVVKQNNVPKAQKVVTSNAPTVTVISPNGGERLSRQATITWSGSDADGDALSYAVLFSQDNGATWQPIAANVTSTSYAWDVSGLASGTQYLIKVVATDGINTGQDTSDAPFTIGVNSYIYLPLILHNPLQESNPIYLPIILR